MGVGSSSEEKEKKAQVKAQEKEPAPGEQQKEQAEANRQDAIAFNNQQSQNSKPKAAAKGGGGDDEFEEGTSKLLFKISNAKHASRQIRAIAVDDSRHLLALVAVGGGVGSTKQGSEIYVYSTETSFGSDSEPVKVISCNSAKAWRAAPLAFSNDGSFLVGPGDSPGTLVKYDTLNWKGKNISNLQGGSNALFNNISFAVARERRHLFACCNSNKVNICDVESGRAILRPFLPGTGSSFDCVAMNPSGGEVALAGYSSYISVIDFTEELAEVEKKLHNQSSSYKQSSTGEEGEQQKGDGDVVDKQIEPHSQLRELHGTIHKIAYINSDRLVGCAQDTSCKIFDRLEPKKSKEFKHVFTLDVGATAFDFSLTHAARFLLAGCSSSVEAFDFEGRKKIGTGTHFNTYPVTAISTVVLKDAEKHTHKTCVCSGTEDGELILSSSPVNASLWSRRKILFKIALKSKMHIKDCLSEWVVVRVSSQFLI